MTTEDRDLIEEAEAFRLQPPKPAHRPWRPVPIEDQKQLALLSHLDENPNQILMPGMEEP